MQIVLLSFLYLQFIDFYDKIISTTNVAKSEMDGATNVRKDCFIFMGKHKIDYAFKSYVLREHGDLIQKQKECSLRDYAINQLNENGVLMPFLRRNNGDSMSLIDLYQYSIENGLERELSEVFKINHASYSRVKRLKERIETMLLNGDCLFLTLTFNDNALTNTTSKERRVAVSRYLKQFNCNYVANIDFGKENGREHYHAVINCAKIKLNDWRKYGNINVQHIRNRNIKSDKTKLAKYICKLSNHAIKETTERNTLIYSR